MLRFCSEPDKIREVCNFKVFSEVHTILHTDYSNSQVCRSVSNDSLMLPSWYTHRLRLLGCTLQLDGAFKCFLVGNHASNAPCLKSCTCAISYN